MKATQQLHDAGQSLWLDNITRRLLTSGTLRRYVAELSITGLTSNPTIFDHAIKNSQDYDDAMVYMNLLYLRKADMACNDPEAKAQAKKMSDEFSNKAMDARKRKAEAAAKKNSGGGITMDQKK